MHLPNFRKTLTVSTLTALSVFMLSRTTVAETMSSTNFTVEADALNIGGNRSTSTNYIVEDSLGEIATGEDASSTNYETCSGFQCKSREQSITFTLTQGTSSPGSASAGVAIGEFTLGSVSTSDGSSINSIFLTADSTAGSGTIVSVTGLNGGLQRTSVPGDIITSSTATLTGGTEGFGLCVFSVTEDAESPSSLTKASPYDDTCTKTTGHDVGVVDATTRTIMSSTGTLEGGSAEVLVKAAIDASTAAGSDYSETLTFIASATY